MKTFTIAITALSLAFPIAAQAQRLTEAQLIERVTEMNVCEGRPVVSAKYVSIKDYDVVVTCGTDKTGFIPMAGAGLGLGGAGAAAAGILGIAAVAAAAGGGGSTPDTQ